jgi:selenocysteine lyase/cysteine desulfurase
VIVNDQDHPSNVLPWLALRKRGIVVRVARSHDYRVPLESISREMTSRTRVVAISHVQHRSGFRCNLSALAEMCHSQGAWLVADAIQSVGSSSFDVRELRADAAACGSYKHMLSTVGSGFLYCAEELLEVMEPVYAGPSPVVRGNKDTNWQVEVADRRDARRLEAGSVNDAGAVSLGAGLDLHFKYGPRRIQDRIACLAARTALLLREAGCHVICSGDPMEMSGLITFKVDSAQSFRDHLLANGIFASTKDTDLIRVSVHAYTLEWELDRLAEVVAEYRPR